MKNTVFLVLLGVAIAIAQNITVGIVRMKGTSNDPTVGGLITFTQSGTTVTMSVNLTGITQNVNKQHGIHIHQFGDISDLKAGMGVGTHWNTYNHTHGCPPDVVRHLGDTGNWNVSADGTLVQSKTFTDFAVYGNVSLIGLAVIFHNDTDDCNITTSSGTRLAQGVIGVMNPTTNSYIDKYPNISNLAAPPSSYYANNDGPAAASAICVFQSGLGALSGISGWIRFDQPTPTAPTVVTAAITGLAAGNVHGIHIHQYGDLSTTDGNSLGNHFTGPYFDPTSMHSIPGSGMPHHVGDMGNMYTYDSVNNTFYFNFSSTDFGLWGHPNNILGRGVIAHNAPDMCIQPYGNAGTRASYCVIGATNPAFGGLLGVPAAMIPIPTAQNTSACIGLTSNAMTSASLSTSPLTTVALTTVSPVAAGMMNTYSLLMIISALVFLFKY